MSKSETISLWAERLRRFDSSGTTIVAFCAAEGVSQPAYYYWRRKLRGAAIKNQPKPVSPTPAFLPVTLAPTIEQGPAGQLNPTERVTRPATSPRARTTIELPGGIRIRIEVPTEPRHQSDSSASGSREDRS